MHMAEYRIYHLDRQTAKVTSPGTVLNEANDDLAMAAAKKLVNGLDVEVWQAARKVGLIKSTAS